VGVVGIGVGTIFGLMASSKNEDSKAECSADDPNRCSAAGVEMRDEAMANGNVATVAFIVGGAALAGAGALWLLDSESERTGASAGVRPVAEVGPGRAAFFLRGRF
jgi:hypothetical protein